MSEKKQTMLLISVAIFLTAIVAGYNVLFVSPINVYNIETKTVITDNKISDSMPLVTYYDETGEEISLDENTEKANLANGKVELININTSDISELTKLHGIGDVLASRIVDYRNEHGDFSSIEELINVKGIGENKLSAIIDEITI